MLNPCGHRCEATCPHIASEGCEGCEKLEGKVFWVKYMERETCPFYECAKGKGYDTCGKCDKLPCQTWFEVRDPDMTDDEAFKADIEKRVENLKK